MGRYPSSDVLLRNPTTGIVPCCAPAASGHAAATPTSVMNSRRFTRSPRRRTAGVAGGRRGRALGSFEIDDQFELGWSLHRQVGRLLAPEDTGRAARASRLRIGG